MHRLLVLLLAIPACELAEPTGTTTQAAEGDDEASDSIEELADQILEDLDPLVQSLTPISGSTAQVAVVMLDFDDSPLLCSEPDIETSMDVAEAVYVEASDGRLDFDVDVVGHFTLPYGAADNCMTGFGSDVRDAVQHMTHGTNLAIADGVDFSAYDRVVFFAPERYLWCKAISIGTPLGTGIAASIVYGNDLSYQVSGVPYCARDRLIAHEMGHGFELDHSSSTTAEYGDVSCTMGSALNSLLPRAPVYFNAPKKFQMGWYNSGQVRDVSGTGIQAIGPLADNDAPTLMLRREVPGTEGKRHYYISYRTPIGFDANLPASSQYRVQVHESDEGKKPILDSHPTIQMYDKSVRKARLAAGGWYFGTGLTVRVASTSDDSAVVWIW